MSWSVKQYVTFEDERTRPVRDLLRAIPTTDARRAIDLGCGPGNSTEALAAHFPQAAVSGMDSSPEMIEAARKRLPNIPFEVAAIETWSAKEPLDVIFANAALQWVPDHVSLYPRLVAQLAPGGSLAVQTPDNLDEPAHRLMREVAADGPWKDKLAKAAGARAPRESPDWYYNLMKPHCVRVDVWRTIYHHPLAGGANGIVEWFKATGLRPFINPLSEAEREAYLDRYRAELAKAYPALDDGTVLLPFPRLFVVATQ
ncbi:trans-aconitate 2-methyltransferase [Terrarubrum flagellatum]|uniref:trans-aconitate 2-methyltransferase n=1 Tax=Terrirubrum flagellatum TaxID=2895980 RepID=UPI003145223A